MRWQHPQRGLLAARPFIAARRADRPDRAAHRVGARAGAAPRPRAWRDGGVDLPSPSTCRRATCSTRGCREGRRLLARTACRRRARARDHRERADGRPGARRCDGARPARRRLRLAIDDFGTGYSSLAYLTQLPVTAQDRPLLRHANGRRRSATRSIVRSTIELAHDLGLQRRRRGRRGCRDADAARPPRLRQAQGYHLTRPIPAAELADWLACSSWRDAEPEAA